VVEVYFILHGSEKTVPSLAPSSLPKPLPFELIILNKIVARFYPTRRRRSCMAQKLHHSQRKAYEFIFHD
jgi:hypothetical protein